MIDPKDIIDQFSVEELCQTADDYFKGMSDPTHNMAKPFSSLMEAPILLKDIGLLVSGLRLAKTMTVLDFAAGTCWFSRYLNQLQCKTISCDVSSSALEIGKRLFKEFPIVGAPSSEPSFLHFDGHKIDLPDESVDRIVCNDGFHHVPNQEEVISELARVLKWGGIAGFSEPGRYHSQSPLSQYEMRNYNVLENDILITEIFAIAQKHGFTGIRIMVLGGIELSLSQYKRLTSPMIQKLLKMIFPTLGNTMTDKIVFFLDKGAYVPDSRGHIGLACSVSTDKDVFSVAAGGDLELMVRVTNTGGAIWLNENVNDMGVVQIGTHLYDESDHLIDLDFSRHTIEAIVEPGTTFEQTIRVRFNHIGICKLAIDLVSEHVTWFEWVGSTPKFVTINVKGAQ